LLAFHRCHKKNQADILVSLIFNFWPALVREGVMFWALAAKIQPEGVEQFRC